MRRSRPGVNRKFLIFQTMSDLEQGIDAAQRPQEPVALLFDVARRPYHGNSGEPFGNNRTVIRVQGISPRLRLEKRSLLICKELRTR